jgi:hypothetical protein
MNLNKYDTRLKSYPELDQTLVCGKNIVAAILSDLSTGKKKKLTVQSWIITGPRGSGKTHILALLYWKIKDDQKLS